MNIATGELAAMPASREELEALNVALWERCTAAEHERDALRAWQDAMPVAYLMGLASGVATKNGYEITMEWIRKRPQWVAK